MTALRELGKRLYKGRWGYFFILPNFAIFTIFFLVPVVWSMVLSLLDYQWWGTEFVGLRNYAQVFNDRIFWKAVVNTAYYTFGVVPLWLGKALLIAGLNFPLSELHPDIF